MQRRQTALRAPKNTASRMTALAVLLCVVMLVIGIYTLTNSNTPSELDTASAEATGSAGILPAANPASVIRDETETPPDSEPAEEILSEPEQPAADRFLVLVNADNPAAPGTPPNLAKVSDYVWTLDREILMDKDALVKLKELFDAAAAIGYSGFRVTHGYRTAEDQQALYDSAEDKSYVAQPGYSEHHTGLAADISYDGVNIGNSEQGEWLANNAHLYGFIQRYPPGKEDITQIAYEPWHYRYIGEEHAAYIYENNLVLEEYLAVYDFS